MVKATGVGVLGVIAIPAASTLPSISFTIPLSPEGINAADLWLDADVNGEAAIVSLAIQ